MDWQRVVISLGGGLIFGLTVVCIMDRIRWRLHAMHCPACRVEKEADFFDAVEWPSYASVESRKLVKEYCNKITSEET